MSPKECLQQIVSGVQIDLADYQHLKRLLNEQHNLLRRRDVRALTELLTRQQSLLSRLRDSAGQRTHLLSQLGLDASDHGMRDLMNRLPTPLTSRLTPQWKQLQQLVTQCQQQNDINGRLLVTQYEVIRRMLYGEPSSDYAPLTPGGNVPY